MTFLANIAQGKAQSRRCYASKSHFGESQEIIISPSRLDDDSSNFYDISSTNLPEICRQSLVRRPVVSLVRLLVRPWPYRVGPAAGKSCGCHFCPIPCSLCNLMYTHTLMVLQHASQHSQHQSTARTLVPSGPFGLAEHTLLFQHFFLFQKLRPRWEHLESTRFWQPISSNYLCGSPKILFQAFRAV